MTDCTRHGRPVSDYCGTAHNETSVARRDEKRLPMQNGVESDMPGVRLKQWCNLWRRFRFTSGEWKDIRLFIVKQVTFYRSVLLSPISKVKWSLPVRWHVHGRFEPRAIVSKPSSLAQFPHRCQGLQEVAAEAVCHSERRRSYRPTIYGQ